MNRIIAQFNQNYAGKLTPHGQALVSAGLLTEAQLAALGAVIPAAPLVPEGNPAPWHNLLATDLRIGRAVKLRGWREALELVPFADVFNRSTTHRRRFTAAPQSG